VPPRAQPSLSGVFSLAFLSNCLQTPTCSSRAITQAYRDIICWQTPRPSPWLVREDIVHTRFPRRTTWALCAESRDRRQCAEYIVEVCGLWCCMVRGTAREIGSSSVLLATPLIDSFLYWSLPHTPTHSRIIHITHKSLRLQPYVRSLRQYLAGFHHRL
jgi:hypothetical protein